MKNKYIPQYPSASIRKYISTRYAPFSIIYIQFSDIKINIFIEKLAKLYQNHSYYKKIHDRDVNYSPSIRQGVYHARGFLYVTYRINTS